MDFSVKTYLYIQFVLSNTKKKILSKDVIHKFLQEDNEFPLRRINL